MVNYQWHIFWANLDPTMGSEQSGMRPVLVVSIEEVNQVLPIVTVLPLTSARPGRKVYPTEAFLSTVETGLQKDSIAMAHQIRTIDKERLGEQCGFIDNEKLKEKVKNAVKVYLDI